MYCPPHALGMILCQPTAGNICPRWTKSYNSTSLCSHHQNHPHPQPGLLPHLLNSCLTNSRFSRTFTICNITKILQSPTSSSSLLDSTLFIIIKFYIAIIIIINLCQLSSTLSICIPSEFSQQYFIFINIGFDINISNCLFRRSLLNKLLTIIVPLSLHNLCILALHVL